MENVVVFGFAGSTEARRALPELRRLHDAREIHLRAAAVVGRRDDGRSFALEQAPDDRSRATAREGVVGLLTGPFGLVLEHAPGALVGSLVDVADPRRSDQLVRCFGDAVPPGSVVTVALVTETEPEPVDALASRLGAALTRRSREDVEREIGSADERPRRSALRDRLRGVKDAVARRR